MTKKSNELFTESIKQAILHHVGLIESQCETLAGHESFNYKVQFQGELCALRISHSTNHNPAQIRGELEWLAELQSAHIAAPVVKTLPSGDRYTSIADGQGGAFTAVLFEWAHGKHVWEIKDSPWAAPLFEQLGALCGKMHALAKTFTFANPGSDRPHWYDEPNLDISDALPKYDQAIAGKYERLNHQIRQVHQGRQDYGMIHGDVHRGNFLLTPQGIQLLNFDNCKFHLFMADIAVVLFHAIPFDLPEAMQQSAAQRFMQHFMAGYQQENQLDGKWFNWLPALLKQQEIKTYAALHRRFDISDIDEMDRWSQNFLFHRRERLLSDTPVVELDWRSFASNASQSYLVAV